jgi:hypothetical protein
MQEPWPFNIIHSPVWFGHKFKGAGLRYEVGLSIIGGDIVWLNGPFPCGQMNDMQIFRDFGMKDALEEGERVEADDGYAALDPEYVKTRSSPLHSIEMRDVRNSIRARHETVNKRLKQWGVLREVFRHDSSKHSMCFRAVAVLTQLSIENGEPLFPIKGYR